MARNYQSESALAGLPGRALLAPAGFRGAGRARPGRRRRLPLPAPRARGGAGSPSREAKSKRRFCRGFRVNEAQRLG